MQKIINNNIFFGDALDAYASWESPDLILSDGPYGLGLYPGEPKNVNLLKDWYKPHVEKWSELSKPSTTLWFWNTELGWANVHPLLNDNGWIYKETLTWNKGKSHIAGKVNSKTIRGLPVVTEIAVRYIRKPIIKADGINTDLKEWLRTEWLRSKLPLNKANEACGVKNVATRKYLTKDDLWYWPPIEAIQKMSDYCNKNGDIKGKPYFNLTQQDNWMDLKKQWNDNIKINLLRAKWNHQHGLTNVWDIPPLRNQERLKKKNGGSLHINQKPLEIIKKQIELSTCENDIIWEPFGGTGTVAFASKELGRKYYVSENNKEYYNIIIERLNNY
jgi:site-specific DNA-methyltransferase (adenine-specific)